MKIRAGFWTRISARQKILILQAASNKNKSRILVAQDNGNTKIIVR